MRRKAFVVALVAAVLTALPTSAEGEELRSLEEQVEDAARRITEARVRADAASAQFSEAQSALDVLAEQVAVLDADVAARATDIAALEGQLQELAIDNYMHVNEHNGTDFFSATDLNEALVRDALTDQVGGHKSDVLGDLRAAKAELEVKTVELERQQAEQRGITEKLAADNDVLQREVANLQAEYQRLDAILVNAREEERRRILSETRRRASEESARRAEQRSRRSSTGGRTVDGPFQCPIPAGVSFSNDWGNPRSGGRRHQGTDMMARAGTEIVAPVSGRLEQKSGGIGGLTFRITADDGTWYYGAHMEAYAGTSGRVNAGDVIGYVGSTGNASTPHLHFEIHPGGYGNPINPYPTVAQYC